MYHIKKKKKSATDSNICDVKSKVKTSFCKDNLSTIRPLQIISMKHQNTEFYGVREKRRAAWTSTAWLFSNWQEALLGTGWEHHSVAVKSSVAYPDEYFVIVCCPEVWQGLSTPRHSSKLLYWGPKPHRLFLLCWHLLTRQPRNAVTCIVIIYCIIMVNYS